MALISEYCNLYKNLYCEAFYEADSIFDQVHLIIDKTSHDRMDPWKYVSLSDYDQTVIFTFKFFMTKIMSNCPFADQKLLFQRPLQHKRNNAAKPKSALLIRYEEKYALLMRLENKE